MESIKSVNQEALRQAISIMERVVSGNYRFNMSFWSSRRTPGGRDVDIRLMDENSVHGCGMAACFGGWVGLSPEWRAIGGSVIITGAPVIRGEVENFYGADAIAKWLNVDQDVAEVLTCTGVGVDDEGCSNFYGGKKLAQIAPSDVLEKLVTMLH